MGHLTIVGTGIKIGVSTNVYCQELESVGPLKLIGTGIGIVIQHLFAHKMYSMGHLKFFGTGIGIGGSPKTY